MASPDALASVMKRITDRWPIVAVARELTGADVPVFPCVPGGKRPLTRHGFHDATNDPDQAEAWWRKYPNANIGVPTGGASGVVVVDVDVHGPVDGFASFDRVHRTGLVSGWQVLVTTPSGGMHAYYRATPDLEQPSWQAARAGIDFRGDGGYVIVPPSTVPTNGSTGQYRVRRVDPGVSSVLDSERLREVLAPRPTAHRGSVQEVERSADITRLTAWVAARGEGERNRGLFWAACRLAENSIPAPEALEVLAGAASEAGLGAREITATVRSAYRTVQPRPQSTSRAQDSSAAATDGWFSRETTVRASPGARGLS